MSSANVTCPVTGSVVVYRQASQAVNANPIDFGIPYFSISLGLNLILTLMIVIRIVRHSRDVRDAIGSLVRPKRLYGAIVTIFVESSALYAVVFLLYIAPWGAGSSLQFIFFPILSQVQVCATFSRCAAVLGYGYLIMGTNRSSLSFSSFYESPSRGHWWATLLSPVISVPST
jgi:hypothetical protein